MKNKLLLLVPPIILLLFSISLNAQIFPDPRIEVSTPSGPITAYIKSHLSDLDGDGDLDVIDAGYYQFKWHENIDGLGNFIFNQDIDPALNYAARDIQTADLDGDGDMDIISVLSGFSVIYWYENTDGLGNFGPAQTVVTQQYGTFSVFPADLDGDGDIDILSASTLNNNISWYENTDGLGSFGSPQVIENSSEFLDVYAADLDGDSDLDVLSASRDDDRIAWYENDGLGNFGPQQTVTTIADEAALVFAADIDGDQDNDILSGSKGDNKIAWYENTDGLGTFGSEQIIPLQNGTSLSSIFPADIDGDGDIDVLSVGSHGVAWHENIDCLGTFISQENMNDTGITYFPEEVYAGDIDLDGDMDVLAGFAYGVFSAWYENKMPPLIVTNLPDIVVICDEATETLCAPSFGSCANTTYSWYYNGQNQTSHLVSNDQCFIPDQIGTYTLIVQNDNGYFLNHTVTVQSFFPEPVLGNGSEICLGELVSIDNQGFNNPDFEITWFHNGDLVQQGGVTLMSSFTSGTITVEIASDGCATVSTTVEIIECCPDNMRLEIDCETQTIYIANFPNNIAGAGVSSWYFNGDHIPGQPLFAPTFHTSQGEGTYEVTILFELNNGEQCEFNGVIEYLESNCCDELGPTANASFVNVESYTTEDTYYGPMEIPVLCDFTLDASASLCEENYTLSISELDLQTWNTTQVMPWTAFSGPAGNSIDLAQLMQPATFTPGQAYLLAFNVGPNGTTKYLAFIYGLNAVATVLNSNSSITMDTHYGPMEVPVINCGLRLDGSQSTCEDSYHIIIQPYDPISWTPTGPPIYDQWFSGQAPNTIPFPGVFPSNSSGEFYLLTFAVGPTWTPTYIPLWYECQWKNERNLTNGISGSSEVVTLFPNPTNTVITLRTSFDSGTYQILDLQGKILGQSALNSSNTVVDLSRFSAGAYFIKIESANGEIHFKKVIKE